MTNELNAGGRVKYTAGGDLIDPEAPVDGTKNPKRNLHVRGKE